MQSELKKKGGKAINREMYGMARGRLVVGGNCRGFFFRSKQDGQEKKEEGVGRVKESEETENSWRVYRCVV